jgi:hypothetical protein
MPVVQILLGGSDVTSKVVFATAHFTSKVNGQPGQGFMRVRDDDSTFSLTTGADWLVLVDGDAAWRGFAMQAKRVYIAPAMDVSVSGLQRFVDVLGPDGNILFDRRIAFDKSSPANVTGTQFPAGTADTTAISDIVANWLDLSADSIDTSSGVTHVGNLDPAQATRVVKGGWTWQGAMDTVNMLPNGIYYLRPESGSPHFTLVYCDVDTPTSPFGLSDTPDGTSTLGFREMEILSDGTGLTTDDLAWGTGYGSQVPVFRRYTDSTALGTHGRWQDSQLASGVYRQSTIDAIAHSYVYGSVSNHRGAKDDRMAVELVTYHPGLLAGHVVSFASNVWSYSDTIPVRQSDLTFDAPDSPRWKLVLSHAIDTPYGFYDQFWPGIPHFMWPMPCLTPPCVPTPGPPPPVQCPPTPPGSSAYWDSFQRTVGSGLGTADSGAVWTVDESSCRSDLIAVHASVAPGDGTVVGFTASSVSGNPTRNDVNANAPVTGVTLPFDCTVVWSADHTFNATNWIGGSNSTPDPHDNVSMGDWWHGPPSQLLTIQLVMGAVDGWIGMATAMDGTHGAHWGSRQFLASSFDYVNPLSLTPYTFVAGRQYTFRVHVEDGFQQYKMWAPSVEAEPDWQTTTAYAVPDPVTYIDFLPQRETLFTGSAAPAVAFHVHLVDFTGYADRPCYWTGGVPTPPAQTGPPTGPNGWGCEVPARSSSTVYTTSSPFAAGSLLVWRAGLFQRPGTDFTEGSDLQSITFTTAVGSSEEVRACYLAQVRP